MIGNNNQTEEDDALISLKKAAKIELLKQRDLERQNKLQEERERLSKNKSESEKASYIVSQFEEIKRDLLATLENVENCEDKLDALQLLDDRCYTKLDELHKLITSSAYFINGFHQRRFHEGYQYLNEKCQRLEQKLRPRKKFGFSNANRSVSTNKAFEIMQNGADKLNVNTVDIIKLAAANGTLHNGFETAAAADQVDDHYDTVDNKSVVLSLLDEDSSNLGFRNRTGEKLTMNHEQVRLKDVALSNLDRCEVRIFGGPNTLYMASLKNCRVLCGPTSTSIFIETCENCTFMLASQQLRVHSTRDCKFYVHVTSRAIIEDTKAVQFAPYAWKYTGIEKHFDDVNLNENINNWSTVDDFNWLSTVPSPNWSIIANADRICFFEDE